MKLFNVDHEGWEDVDTRDTTPPDGALEFEVEAYRLFSPNGSGYGNQSYSSASVFRSSQLSRTESARQQPLR